jgi:ankyrin repeat protein
MTLKRLPPALLAAASLTLTIPLRAQATDPNANPDLRELLRDALYTEEVTRDPEAAAKQYEDLLSKHDAQRAFAAAALFRLAEVRRKQDRKDEAIALYQRLLSEFPAAESEGKLAMENLAAMGAKVEVPASPAGGDEEDKELSRLEALAITHPDTISDPSIAVRAVGKSHLKILQFFIDKNAGFDFNRELKGRSATLLDGASESGALEACRMLLDAGADPNAPANRHVLSLACENGFSRIVELLLARGSDPNGHGTGDPLRWAVTEGHPEIVSLLVGKGANPNLSNPKFSHAGGATPIDIRISRFGAPIHRASMQESTEMLELLLKLGADPNLAETSTGLTALHLATNPDWNGNAKAIPILLKAGAKPDLAAKAFRENTTEDEWPAGLTPMMVAVRSKNFEAARTLLGAGASANQPRLLADLIDQGPDAIPLIQLLLEAGCDPNAADPSDEPPIIRVFSWDLKGVPDLNDRVAKHHKQVELIQLLLKHGADPNTTYGTYFRSATRPTNRSGQDPQFGPFRAASEKSEEFPASVLMKVVRLKSEQLMNNVSLIQTLLDAGAKPSHEFPEVFDFAAQYYETRSVAKALLPFRPATLELDRSGYFLNWNPAVIRLVLDEVLNPAIAAKGGVHLAFVEHGGYQMLVEAGAPIPATAELLLANVESLTRRPGLFAGQRQVPELTRVRRDAAGQWSREAIDWNGDEPLPELAEGDIIEMAEKKIPTENSQDQEFTDQVAWHLRKRISFPVTLEIGGEAREIQLRGDLLSFDPTRNEAPLLSAGHLAGLFFPLSTDSGLGFLKPDTLLTVRRKDSPDIRMDLSARGAFEFTLQAGDQLILPDPGSVLDPKLWYRFPVRLVVPDGGPVRSFGPVADMTFTDKPSLTMPTLIQVLTDSYASRSPLAQGQEASTRFPEFSKRIQAGEIPVVLPHPDFSRIRIKRKDEILEIDLSVAIQRCGDDTPFAEVRKADVPLQPGDVVELPQNPGTGDQAWTGFTKEEERFFRKSLGGVVMVRKPDGIIEPVEVSYQAPVWQQTPHGMISSAPASGVTSSRLKALTGMEARGLKLKRDGHELTIDANDAFVRDGDEIIAATPVRQPRPRIVPPPPSR